VPAEGLAIVGVETPVGLPITGTLSVATVAGALAAAGKAVDAAVVPTAGRGGVGDVIRFLKSWKAFEATY
jgi:hypothetical protein